MIQRTRAAPGNRDLPPKPGLVHRKGVTFAQDNGTLNHVLQLTDVPGPRIILQPAEVVRMDWFDPSAHPAREALGERSCKQRDVVAALTQRINAFEADAKNQKASLEAQAKDLETRERLAAKKLNDAQKLLASYDEAKHQAALKLAG